MYQLYFRQRIDTLSLGQNIWSGGRLMHHLQAGDARSHLEVLCPSYGLFRLFRTRRLVTGHVGL